jgi:hypothetical protein
MKYCIYTRSFFENDYLTHFIEHYIYLGFDKIIILHVGGSPYNIPEIYIKNVDIHYVENKGDDLLPIYDYLVKNSNYDWILSVDIDEFLILNKKYKNINEYVEDKLQYNIHITGFYFRWGIIEKYDIDTNNNFSYLLNNYNIYSNPHIKMMFKRNKLIHINHPHFATLKNTIISFENHILTENQPVIELNEYSYNECILIHLHTRNLHNLVFKSFQTLLTNKYISLKNEFITFINSLDLIDSDTIISTFTNYIGIKAILPFVHRNNKLIDISEYDISNYNYNIMDDDSLYYLDNLKTCKINLNNYFYYIEKISEKMLYDKTFIKQVQ